MTETTLVVQGLTKSYGSTRALEALDFSVGRGEVFALLGPNGAGKTTTLEIIEGIREADAGRVRIDGIDAFARRGEAAAHLGVQLQAQGLPPTMSPAEALSFFSAYRRKEPRSGILERFGLGAHRDKPTRDLSTGLQRRLALALALAHEPSLLVLDEPTAGLDVESRNVLHEAIREERARGTGVLLASHDMAEVEKLADRALVLVGGREVARGSPRELTACGDSATRLALRTRDGSLEERLDEFPGLEAAAELDRDGYIRAKVLRPGPLLSWLLREVEGGGDEIVDLRVERPSLEERFLELSGGAA
ncbi:MAG TPA: ABC transporter ATP-binding protein [Rectinemataceae bacterium]|nr:ABC transporter ATP-binding protein [Rectinemataceae bacterium]